MGLLAEELQDEVRQLEAQNYEEAKEWASQGVHPCVCGPPCTDTCDEALHELIECYRPKRLHVQMRYLSRKSKADEESGWRTAILVRERLFSLALRSCWHTSRCTSNAILAAKAAATAGAKARGEHFLRAMSDWAAVALPCVRRRA